MSRTWTVAEHGSTQDDFGPIQITRRIESDRKSDTMEPKYPNITVRLVGEDGNAFSIIGRTRKALRRGGVSSEEVKQFTNAASPSSHRRTSCPTCHITTWSMP